MPTVEDLIQSQYQSSERLGQLWRSQGQAFLDAQAAELIDDVARLREVYVQRQEEPVIIDLRGEDVAGMACSREGHGAIEAAARCRNCRRPFCASCVVRPDGATGEALCTECALVLGGIHHKRSRPLVAAGRPGRKTRR
jgi:hypothetical protein